MDTDSVRAIFDQASGEPMLAADQVYEILEAYGIDVPDWRMAGDMESAVAAADAIGYPVVLKADATSVIHKSDMGGVAVNLTDAEAVKQAAKKMSGRIDAQDLRFFVQQFVPGG